MKIRITLLLLSILSFVLLNSCKEEPPVTQEPDPTPEPGEVIIPTTSKSVSNNDYNNFLVSISTDSTTFTFSSDFTTKYNPEVGDVLAIQEGSGLLRKVTNVTSSSNQIVISTKQGKLTDAIEQGKIVFRHTLNKSSIESITYLAEGVMFNLEKGQDADFIWDIDKVLYDADGNENTTDDQVKLIGNCTINADVICDIDIKFPSILQYAILGLEAFNEMNLELIAGVQYNVEKQFTIARVDFPSITILILGWPVVFTPVLKVNIGISGYAEGQLRTEVVNAVTFEAGIEYNRGQGWSYYENTTNHFDFTEPQITTNAGARGYIGPEISLAVYSVLAGYADAYLYGEILADLSQTPWWELYAGINFGVGVRDEIFGGEVVNYYKDNILDFRWLITQANTGTNTAPTALFTVDPTNGNTNTIFNFDASECTDNEDPVSDLEVRWDWESDGSWDTQYSTVKTATHQYVIEGQYNAKLEVKDTGGLTDEHNETITVASGGEIGLVAYYPFNGNANDESGNGNNGTVTGATLTQDRFGNSNSAYSFDGENDYIQIPHSQSLNITDQISVSYWVKLETSAPYYFPYHIIEKHDSWGSGQREWDINFGLADIPVWSQNLSPGVYYNYTMTYNGSVINLYKDGILDNSANYSESIPQSTSDIMIGEYLLGGDYYFDGIIDDIRIYDKALNETEILEIYNEGGWTGGEWQDGFESYTTGSFPSNWIPDGNATDNSTNYVTTAVSYEGSKSLQLYGVVGGCWAAIAYRPVTVSSPFEIQLAIRNGAESLSGCNPDRAKFGLRQGTSWTNPSRTFIQFKGDGTIVSGGGGVSLGTYSTLTWYTIRVRYERPSSTTVKLSYWANGIYKGDETLAAISEEDQLTNLELSVLEGTAWFDDIRIEK